MTTPRLSPLAFPFVRLPLPSARLIVTSLAVAALALPTGWALALPGAVQALGTASAFAIETGGVAWNGGVATWSYACASCFVRVTVAVPDLFLVAQEGNVFLQMPPGTYDIDGFAGYASYTFEAPRQIFVELHGAGRVAQR